MSTTDAHHAHATTHEQLPAAAAAARRCRGSKIPIVPHGTIAGRALVAVVAIMTFLASLTTGAVMLVRAAASDWQSDMAREVTIQVRPAAGSRYRSRHREGPSSIARAHPGHRRGARPIPRQESGALAGAVARHRAGARAICRCRASSWCDRVRRGARPGAICASRWPRRCRAQPRRSSRLGRPHARDGRHRRARRHRGAGAGAGRHHAVGDIRDPRRHGGQPPGDRGAAFHRRQERIHRRPFPAPFPGDSG